MKFTQISKLISRLRYVNVNYGSLFGTFLDNLANTYDKGTSETLKNAKNDEELEKLRIQILEYHKKKVFLELYSNGNKSKLNKFVVDLFLVGKSRKNWISKLSKTRYENHIANIKDETVRRILINDSEDDSDNSINFSVLLKELKYWIYMASWLFKIYCHLKIQKLKDE